MKSKIIMAAFAASVSAALVGGDGASQRWVNYRIAQEATNTAAKITAATNAIMPEVQSRIDAHLSTNGVTGAWVEYKIAEQETNTQATVDQKLVAVTNAIKATIVTTTETATTKTYKCGILTVIVYK